MEIKKEVSENVYPYVNITLTNERLNNITVGTY